MFCLHPALGQVGPSSPFHGKIINISLIYMLFGPSLCLTSGSTERPEQCLLFTKRYQRLSCNLRYFLFRYFALWYIHDDIAFGCFVNNPFLSSSELAFPCIEKCSDFLLLSTPTATPMHLTLLCGARDIGSGAIVSLAFLYATHRSTHRGDAPLIKCNVAPASLWRKDG
ncbi:hypothetical protein B0H34DRAFT_701519 [Crassisporium funariophilum]|nr:hypothetical protein B0H34DRAFT_701519 [Crassisporium funariophilum]